MRLPVAFSPCPNDTFIFHSWVSGGVGADEPTEPILADVQHLNEWCRQRRYPVSKLSVACLGTVLADYVMLPVGAALGHGCGPLIIAKEPFSKEELRGKKIAIPGKDTTAYLLLCILFGVPEHPIFCQYDEIRDLIASGEADCGVIIHETRFTYKQEGFNELVDLGRLWEERTGLPIPLGAIAAKRSLGQEQLQRITSIIEHSLQRAYTSPEGLEDYILKSSSVKDKDIVAKHIDLYVNEDTRCLSQEGKLAVETLFSLASELQLMPKVKQPIFFENKSEAIL